jgi:serine/threonine protein kinase
LTIKIANFGLSYDRCSEDYCCIRSHKATPVPLRWLAPETIHHNKVSVYSDIWSYGVLLWEVFSFGARPYSDLSNAAVAEAVLSGQVLPRPERCPHGVYDIMLRCWNQAPSKRPWFHTLRPELAAVPKMMNRDERKSVGVGPATPEIQRALRTLAAR